MHDDADNVGVAVVDITKGQSVSGRSLQGKSHTTLEALSDIPLGHKIALKDFAVDDTVIKYACDVGRIVAPVKRGEHVHIHNLKTKRW